MFRIEARQDQDEFVAAEPGDGIRFAHRAGQSLGDRLQQLVAGVVTQGVVDALEMIEVQKQACNLMRVARRLGDDLFQALIEQCAVGQPGENVVLGKLVCLRRSDLELLGTLGDLVLERALIGGNFGLRFGESLRHVIEGMRQQSELVARICRHVNVELVRRRRRARRA